MRRFLSLLFSIGLFISLLAAAFPAYAASTSPNLVPNPSVETVASNGQPVSWLQGRWGTNTATFTYENGSSHTGNRSLYVNMTKHTSGDAKWYFNNVAVTAGQSYTFSDYYKSNVATEIDVQYTAVNGALSYGYLTNPAVSSNAWQAVSSTFTVPSNVKALTVFHLINKVGWLQTDDFSLTAKTTSPTPPTVSFTQPTANAVISGSQTISVNASDAVGIANVQFKVDGHLLGGADTAAPYEANLDSTTLTNGNHVLTAVATNTAGLTTSASETVNVNNVVVTPPTISMLTPLNNSTVSGSQTISANASDAQGISSVQFKLDGNNLGSPVLNAPYSINWDTTAVSNGSHTLTAVATNTAGLTSTAPSVNVNVQNNSTSVNLIPNPSLETAQDTSTPLGWQGEYWGSNTSVFSYLNTGYSGQRSVEVQVSNYSNGASEWYYGDVPVSSGQTYEYSDWYQSNIDTEVDAEVIVNGTPQYFYLGKVLANSSWTNFKTTFTVPAGATAMSVYHLIAGNGYLITDNYSLAQYTPVPWNRGIVSISFDDGWANQYQNAFPLLQANGQTATFNIISGSLTDQPDYMSGTQVKNLFSNGMEIASHTVTHTDLTTVSQTQLVYEMSQSQATLQNLLGAPVTDFAYPYGSYNTNTITVGEQYYQSQRTVDAGLNTKDNFDPTKLKIYEVDSNISQAQVQGWVNAAIQQKSWLILVYHEIAVTPVDPTDSLYDTQPSDLAAELSYIKQSGVAVETVHQALVEVESQL
jgi:peptidoglycan/xylan/chitin deacetylase (PgdA/CDA1 family)